MLSGLKMSGSFRLVISRVFVGGVGWVSGGKLDRSSESDDLEDPRREYSGRAGDEGEVGDVGDCGDSVPDMLADLRYIVEKSMCSCDGMRV